MSEGDCSQQMHLDSTIRRLATTATEELSFTLVCFKNLALYLTSLYPFFSDIDYEQYNAFMLKYACGNPDEELDLEEHSCQPVYDHKERVQNGEKCFSREDYILL